MTKTKLAIFVGDAHDSDASRNLLSNIAQDCTDKGLSFRILSEGDLEKDERFDGFDTLKAQARHVFKDRDDFNKRKFDEWRSRSSETPRQLVKEQIDAGNYSIHRQAIEQDLEHGTISGLSPEELRKAFGANSERAKLIDGATKDGGARFDFDSHAAFEITADQLLRVSLNSAMQKELVFPQITEARKEKQCDVEIVMFGDAHLPALISHLEQTEYSQSKITAFSTNRHFIGPDSIHPMAESGLLKSYDTSGALPQELEEKLSEVAAQKAHESAKEVASGLLKQVREFKQGVPEEDKKLINQFTEEGVDLLVDYYNTKYPERGQIHRIQAPMTLNIGIEETNSEKNSRTTIETREAATQGLSQLLENNRPPLKVILTFLQKETPDSEFLVERGRHSIPILITDEKLILLRDEANPATPESLKVVAQNLGLSFVQQKEPAQYTVQTDKGPKIKETSIQGDHSNCNGIAVGILKDLTAQDVARVSAFEDRYTPLPKMLKYSQSENFILRTYPELANEPVKFDKDGNPAATLFEYVHDNSHEINPNTGKEEKTGSRITTKMDRLRGDMSELQAGDKGSWAQKILEKRAQEKESQNRNDGR